jgi:DNA repair protein RecO
MVINITFKEFLLEGIILHSQAFDTDHRILTFFCPDRGILKVFVKNTALKGASLGFLKPFYKVSIEIQKGRADLYYYQEGYFIKNLMENCTEFSCLQIALNLCSTICKFYKDDAPSKQVYMLLEAFLSAVTLFKNPENLLASFQIKLLCFEGLLNMDIFDSTIPFSKEEIGIINLLKEAKTLTELDDITFKKALGLKIQALFEELT